jgi:mannose-6-phosphate isomerase-like protein (cupin superfamily)
VADELEVTALGSTYRYLVSGADTGGRYSLAEETFWGDAPPLHVHEREEESFYVLEGAGVVQVGDERRAVAPGSFVVVPRGVPHTLYRHGEEPLKMLTLLSPAGFEQFFLEVARTPGGEEALTDEELVALAERFHCTFVEG